MIIPIAGEILANISLMFNMYYKKWPMEVAGISEVIFPGLSGGWFLMFLVSDKYVRHFKCYRTLKNFKGIFSYTADITTESERTFRIGIVNIFFSISIPIGMGFSGILLR